MKKVFLAMLLVAVGQGFAQPFYKHWDITIGAGTSNYSGEIANQSTVKTITSEMSFQSVVEINYNLSRTNSIGVEMTFGNWYANDLNHKNLYGRNFEASSNYLHIGMQFDHYFFAKQNWPVQPYAGAGIGVNMYSTKVDALEGAKKPPTLDQARNSGSAFGFDFTVGAMYDFSRKFSMGLEYWLALYTNDQIDNLVYAQKEADKIGSLRVKGIFRLFSR